MKSAYITQTIRQYRLASCDITCNCNLRCKFCFNEFFQKNFNMTEDIFQNIFKVASYLPNTTNMDGKGFYFSCLWEPSIHPHFIELLQLIPKEFKKKVFFTSNFAKQYTDEMIEQLARINVSHINISIETLEREKYKKLTGGTDKNYDNFFSNLERISKIFSKYETAPKLRYISMALKSNYEELEAIVEKCQNDFYACINEIRTPYGGAYVNRFSGELLSKEEITYLERVFEKCERKITYWLQESAYMDKVDEKNEQSLEKADSLPKIALRELPENYYDIRIESNGNIIWQGNKEQFNYDPSADYDSVFSDGLNKLIQYEAMCHVIPGDIVSQYFNVRHNFFNRTFFYVDDLVDSERYFTLRGWAGVKGIDSKRLLKILELSARKQSNGSMYYVCKDEIRPDVANTTKEPFENAGFQLLIDKRRLNGKKFQVRMHFYEKEENRIIYTASSKKYIQLA